ncbi:CHCH domain protein [Ancylostoma duodenale]|uniref:CHCH domain protein n=1 Tax=Ancylostoma duodenale TaxID=51022 RepID=A0A0C2G3C3_9BILA|nr:CHCH domain protein [Ancylostoma duodenale]
MDPNDVYPSNNPGPTKPDGSVNFECHCVGHLVASPCGYEFREAITCQKASTEEELEAGACGDQLLAFMECAMRTQCFKMQNGKGEKGCKISRKIKTLKPTDSRIKEENRIIRKKKEDEQEIKINHAPKISSAMFLKFNNQLGPPFHVLVDTNFVNFAVKNRLDVIQGFRDCLYAHTIPYITDCVMGELEKAGRRFKIALKVIKDARFQRLKCDHKGIYADDCLVQRVTQV